MSSKRFDEGATSLRAIHYSPRLRISLGKDVSKWNVRVQAEDVQALAFALDRDLSVAHMRSNVSGDVATLRLGPDEWLLLGGQLGDAPRPVCSVVDVGHRTVTIEVSGSRAVDLLSAFCPLDLDQSVFQPGKCTRTILGRSQIILWRRGADVFQMEVSRSMAAFVSDLLSHVAKTDIDPGEQ